MWSRSKGRKIEVVSKAYTHRKQLASATIEDAQTMDDMPKSEGRAQQCDSEIGQENRTLQFELDPLLAPDQVASVQEFMGTLELEVAIQELLDRNKGALARLEELQLQRLGGENGGTSWVEVGSEEWDVGE
jgi:hypothetical protein